MQGITKAIRFQGNRVKIAVLNQLGMKEIFSWANLFAQFGNKSSTPVVPHRGLANTTVAELLKAKGDEAQKIYWCRSSDLVYDAVKHMTQSNVGALVVVKPGDQKLVAGIITERDYLQKITVQGRSSKTTRVGEIMTDENKLITVSSDTNILKAMELMAEKRIRHVPVIDKQMVGMLSIVDVVQTVLEQQHEELKHLDGYIKGEYY